MEEDMRKAFEDFKTAWWNLNNAWNRAATGTDFTDGYPFGKSFDELVIEVDKWVRKCVSNKPPCQHEVLKKGFNGGYWCAQCAALFEGKRSGADLKFESSVGD